jgi:hypothetical protein
MTYVTVKEGIHVEHVQISCAARLVVSHEPYFVSKDDVVGRLALF